jgi:hypothetical protein
VTAASSSFENLFPFNPNASTNFAPSTAGVFNNLPLDNGIFKMDYIPGPHHHINGAFYRSQSFQLVNYANGQLLPQWEATVPQLTEFMSGDWTWTPGSTLVNDFRHIVDMAVRRFSPSRSPTQLLMNGILVNWESGFPT